MNRVEIRAASHVPCEDVENGIDRSAEIARNKARNDHGTKTSLRAEGCNESDCSCTQGSKTEYDGGGMSGKRSSFTSNQTKDD